MKSNNYYYRKIAEKVTGETYLKFFTSTYYARKIVEYYKGEQYSSIRPLNKPIRYKYGKKSTNSALNYLGSIKGLDKQAETICRTLNLKTLNDLLNLTVDDLCKVDKIGEKKAEKILSELGVSYEL